MPENVTAARYGARSGDFIRSASVLSCNIHDGWLPSAGLLLGFACELLAKRRLIHEGISEDALRRPPYGHDISGMWHEHTSLFVEADTIVSELRVNPNPNGVTETFDFDLHFEQLASAHSSEGDYSLRYHHGEIRFADPKAMTVVLARVWEIEQARSLNWES